MSDLDRFFFRTWVIAPDRLAIIRMIYGIYALTLLFPVPGWVSDLPGSWFEPPFGPMLILESTPPVWAILAVTTVAALALVAVVAGFKTKAASLVAAGALATLAGIEYSFGKIDHNTFMWAVPLAMAFSGWGNAISFDSRNSDEDESADKSSGWAVSLLMVLLASAMATAAIAKMRGGWLDPTYSATFGHQLNHVFARGGDGFLARQAVDNHIGVVDEVVDWATVLFELAWIPAIFSVRWTRRVVAFAVLFHMSVALVLNIAFMANLAVYAVVVAWPAPRQELRHRIWVAAVAVAAVAAVAAIAGHPLARLAFAWSERGDLLVSTAVLGVATIAAIRFGIGQIRSRPTPAPHSA